MTPYRQLNRGDCYRTCIACLLDMPPLAVPNFAQDRGEEEIKAAREWLAGRGLTLIATPYWKEWSLADVLRYVCELNPNIRFVLSGTTDLGANHAVIRW